MQRNVRSQSGFTLAELLISLAILGVIATFTIPKILSSYQNSQNVAEAKEVAAMISAAYQQAQLAGIVNANTKPSDLTPYMNYVSYDTSGTLVDAHPNWSGFAGSGRNACSASTPCVKLHNGGVLWFYDPDRMGGTSALHVVMIAFDPDNVTSGSASDGPSKSVQFALYYNGYITTRGRTKTGTCHSGGCGMANPDLTLDPAWFTWN